MDQQNINHEWQSGFSIDFDLIYGLSQTAKPTNRFLSMMGGMFADQKAYDEALLHGDHLVYQFFELGCPNHPGDIAFGTSITNPGKIGNEYYFTKGHFHSVLDTGEVYYCLSGQGLMLIENPEGDTQVLNLSPGKAAYVPKRYAHRSINFSYEPLVTFFAFRGDAGHDYGSIEVKGFRKIVVEQNGLPVVIDNPHWEEKT